MIIKRQKTTNLIIQTKNLLLQPITLDYAEEIFKEFTKKYTQKPICKIFKKLIISRGKFK